MGAALAEARDEGGGAAADAASEDMGAGAGAGDTGCGAPAESCDEVTVAFGATRGGDDVQLARASVIAAMPSVTRLIVGRWAQPVGAFADVTNSLSAAHMTNA